MPTNNQQNQQNQGGTYLSKTHSNNSKANLYSRMHVWDDLEYATDPLVTGYSFVQFHVPAKIFDASEHSDESIGKTDVASAETWLSANCYSVTLPDVSIGTVEVEGFQGQWINVPGKLEIGSKTTSATYWETYNLDITQIIRQWVYSIRDPRVGTAAPRLHEEATSATATPLYRSKNYKGYIYWFMTDPSYSRILIAAEFLGTWPTKVPYSAINTDIKTVDKVELSVDFAFDKFYVYPGTITYLRNSGYWATRANHITYLFREKGDGSSVTRSNTGSGG